MSDPQHLTISLYAVDIDIEVDKPSYILRFGDPYRTEVHEPSILGCSGAVPVQNGYYCIETIDCLDKNPPSH